MVTSGTLSSDCTYSGSNRYRILVKLAIKRKQLSDQVSELTTNRLSVYLRCLNTLDAEGVKTVSSQTLEKQFHLNAAQIRKDLAYFGEFGVRWVGYYVKDLKQHLRQILGLDRRLKVAIFGAGNLGLALADRLYWARQARQCVERGGGHRDRVRAYASTLFRPDPASIEEACRRYIDLGFTAVKFGWSPTMVSAAWTSSVASCPWGRRSRWPSR